MDENGTFIVDFPINLVSVHSNVFFFECHKPPMTGNACSTYKSADDWGMLYYCSTNMISGIHL